MCGIVGVMGDVTPATRSAFKQMLYVGTLRGFDSTGIMTATPHSSDWIKHAIPAPDFLGMTKVQKMVDGHSKMLLGHNRAATKGKVVSVNAHPFTFDNITGVHNGTLTSRYKLDDYQNFEVDSENLFYHLQRNGLQDTIDNCTGAYTLVWHDSKDGTLNVFRNKERPFSYCFSEDRKSMYWASEANMLEWILKRNNISHQDIISLPIHTHLSVPVPVSGKVLEPSLKKVEPVKPIYVRQVHPPVGKSDASSDNSSTHRVSSGGSNKIEDLYGRGEQIEFTLEMIHYNAYKQRFFAGLTTDGNKAKVRVFAQQCAYLEDDVNIGKIFSAVISRDPENDVITVSPHTIVEVMHKDRYYGYGGNEYTYDEYKKLCDKGCSWCASPASVDDADVLWFAPTEHLCGGCQQEEDVKQYLSSTH